MNSIELFAYLMLGFILLMVGLLGFLKRKEISAFVYPDRWIYVTMLELDNNVVSWLQRKTPDLRFKFNDGIYNMYDTSGGNKAIIYRSGRLGELFYKEGEANPLDFRTGEIVSNPKLTYELEKTDVAGLFEMDKSPFDDIMGKYGVIIGFVVGFVASMILGG